VTHGVPHSPQPFRVLAEGTWVRQYNLLKKADSFHWTEETQKALDDLKVLNTNPSVLALLEPKTLHLYVAASTQVISAALLAQHQKC
jgi:hypothetical protein